MKVKVSISDLISEDAGYVKVKVSKGPGKRGCRCCVQLREGWPHRHRSLPPHRADQYPQHYSLLVYT